MVATYEAPHERSTRERAKYLPTPPEPRPSRARVSHDPSAPTMPDEATLRALTADLDALGARTYALVGKEDLEQLVRVDRRARMLTAAGRVLIHVGFDPITLGAGILAVAAGKQLNMIEVCHAVLHGTYDQFNHPRLHTRHVRLDAPLSEYGWRKTHGRHHPNVNIVGKDPDARFGVLRQNRLVPHKWHHRVQLLPLAANFVGLSGQLNLMVTGVADFHMRSPEDSHVLVDRSPKAVRAAYTRMLTKAVPYYVKNFALIPALAGPFFPKVLAANAAAELVRNLYTAATVYSGHISKDHAVFPKDTRARSKGEWYWMQIVSSANFEVPRWMSMLSGGLDKHIEHHLYPTLPPDRIRAIAPEVRAICEKHGVPYKSAPWSKVLRNVVGQFISMGRRPKAQKSSR